MSEKQYRVVEHRFEGENRLEIDIGCQWRTRARAQREMNTMKAKNPLRGYSLQPKDRK